MSTHIWMVSPGHPRVRCFYVCQSHVLLEPQYFIKFINTNNGCILWNRKKMHDPTSCSSLSSQKHNIPSLPQNADLRTANMRHLQLAAYVTLRSLTKCRRNNAIYRCFDI
ncbi:hypothetical protein O6H91_22G062600 [Diphasiastrum complanatum]|uniref:Uncharacterized protein n=1 Tax=Diphasiastrum complanatum TaxID=34168 RepID=A0ACC2AHJ6_DIPCM|nr:hypothetical protein O6H91_22G062600 [Diphasiastrum complanatum]